MNRRAFIHTSTTASMGLAYKWPTPFFGNVPNDLPAKVHLISDSGCGRATGYAEANKIVTIGKKTHVSWLDSTAEGFMVQIRTYDHTSRSWSPTFTIGEAFDNHGGPALTADSKGYLHIVYYPHHHEMRYRKSLRPNDSSVWEAAEPFGSKSTYPTLVCGPHDTLYFTCRRSFDESPWQVELWTRSPKNSWKNHGPILAARFPGYAHFQESLSWSPDGKRLHLSCRIHEKTDNQAYGRIQTVGYMMSDDGGDSWQSSNGKSFGLPVTAESIEVLDTGGVDMNRTLRAGALAVDKKGVAHILYSIEAGGKGRCYLCKKASRDQWTRIDLHDHLPKLWKEWDLLMPGGISFNENNEMYVCAQLQQVNANESSWGHRSSEVVLFRSETGGQSFDIEMISKSDAEKAHWLPNIERPTGPDRIVGRPSIIYTSGTPGKSNKDLLKNQVFCYL